MPAAIHERRQKEARDDRRAFRQRQADEDFQAVMGTEHGRRLLWRLLTATDGQATLFATNHTQCVRNASLRDFGKAQITDRALELCPEHFLLMRQECLVAEERDREATR